jgi:hypothetical protein
MKVAMAKEKCKVNSDHRFYILSHEEKHRVQGIKKNKNSHFKNVNFCRGVALWQCEFCKLYTYSM